MRALAIGLVAPSILLAACSGSSESTNDLASAVASQAPLSEGSDQADRSCRIVLRDVSRIARDDGSFAESCMAGACNWLWQGRIDVSKDAFPDGATVGVLYHLASDQTWWEVPAGLGEGVRPGFSHYTFEISEHLVGPSAGDEALASARVELIPFLRLEDGTRLFDHNRRTGDLESYSFGQSEAFYVGDDAVCSSVAASITFQGNWQQSISGPLHAGGWMTIWYDLERLPDCRGTHNGYPAWDVIANVRFLPGGQSFSGSVRRLLTFYGQPTNNAVEQTFEARIPADATSVEVWFRNFSGAGNNCEAWDSNYGSNYRFDIAPSADDPRCKDVERWTSKYGSSPECLGYEIAEQYDATNCEFFVNGFGDGYEGHYGIPFEWVEAWLTVRPQDGELLNVGMLTRYTDSGDGSSHQRFSLGQASGDSYKTGFTWHSSAPQGPRWTYQVDQVAFFIDVRRPAGQVVRLWQSRQGANYSWDDAFGHGTTRESIPYGNIEWANDGAPILESRQACR